MSTDTERDSGGERGRDRDSDVPAATHVTVSYPADLSDWGRFQVEKPAFRSYLQKTLGVVREGDQREEFVGVGCCGDTLDAPLRVEALSGGERVTRETGIEFAVREACGLDGGWRVQSAGGPTT